MATLRMTKPTKDPRTGMWMLRKRVPVPYLAVAGRAGGIVKISTETKDNREALRRWPGVLVRYAEMEAEWERLLNVVALTPATAQEVAAKWAAWIAGGATLHTGGEDSDVFEPLDLPEERTPERLARMWDRVEFHADEAARVVAVEVSPETRPLLVQTMARVVQAAYLDADLRRLGISGPRAVHPLDTVREALPHVAHAPPINRPGAAPGVPLGDLFDAWKATAVVKPRTAREIRYILDQLAAFLGHRDAAKITREELRRWRDAGKAGGLVNNTWNNRLSMMRQVFAHAVADGRLSENPADNSLRLRKSKTATRLPYSDEDAARILLAARKETSPARRWAHWIMAFTGMRVGEVLQLTRGDVRQEGGLWFLAIHEDDEGKSVKTGQRRHVPVHATLIAEGLIAYVQGLPEGGPLFPDKGLDQHGNRGGRGWNAVGEWVRDAVGITDPQKAPNHAWRHRLEDELRAAEVPEDARDAILGHARKTTGRSYGVRGEALARLHRELSRIKPPPGLS